MAPVADYYPPLGFYYTVDTGVGKNKGDARFQSVSACR